MHGADLGILHLCYKVGKLVQQPVDGVDQDVAHNARNDACHMQLLSWAGALWLAMRVQTASMRPAGSSSQIQGTKIMARHSAGSRHRMACQSSYCCNAPFGWRLRWHQQGMPLGAWPCPCGQCGQHDCPKKHLPASAQPIGSKRSAAFSLTCEPSPANLNSNMFRWVHPGTSQRAQDPHNPTGTGIRPQGWGATGQAPQLIKQVMGSGAAP